MHFSLNMYFRVNPKYSQIHQNELLRLLMEIVKMEMIMVRLNLEEVKKQG